MTHTTDDDLPSLPTTAPAADAAQPSSPEAPTPQAQPVASAAPKRRRSTKVAEAPADATGAEAGSADVAATVEAADGAAAEPKRRRRKTVAASADGPVADVMPQPLFAVDPPSPFAAPVARRVADVDPPSGEVATPVVESVALESMPETRLASGAEHESASNAEPENISEAEPERASEADPERANEAEAASDGNAERSSRRRNRRDRKRGARQDGSPSGAADVGPVPVGIEAEAGNGGDDGSGADFDADDDAAEPSEPRPDPADPAELFAQVLKGSFDAEADAAAEEVAAKRVLPPQADAPKLHKVLAQAGIGSRRDMEQWIAEGRVTVNGEPAHIGQRISFGDQVKVGGKPVKIRIAPPPPRVIAYHKPVGEVVTYHDPENRPTVFRRLPRLPQGKWQSVGRLDINTEGLLLFTNSGELANQLMHPRFGVEREYAVRVLGQLDEEQREELLDGVDIDGQEACFRSIEDGGGEGANHWYRVVIAEGRNREVRRLFDAIGLTVSRLIRIRYGNIVLPRGLKRCLWVDLHETDVRAIRRLVGFDNNQRPPQNGKGPINRNNGPHGKRGRPRPPEVGGRPERNNADFDGENHGPIPNPLEQTFDRRFVQKRSGGGFNGSFGGFGPGGSAPPSGGFGGGGQGGNQRNNKGGPKQPDPMQTSVGYIGADAFHRRGNRGGNRGGGGGGGFGGGGFGGGGFGGGGGGRRGGR